MLCRLSFFRLAAVGAAAALLVACSGPIDDTNERVYFAPLENDQLTTEVVPGPSEPSEEEMAQYRPIMAGVERNASRLFRRDDVESRLPTIEQVYIDTGRYLDLIGLYQNEVDKQGISSRIAPRLLRHYLRLGQRHLARELLDEMIVEREDEPMTWFLNGTYWLPDAEQSQEATARVVASWERALEIDPNFEGSERPDLPPLEQQLELLERRVPEEAVAEARAELEEGEQPPRDEATARADGSVGEEPEGEEAAAEVDADDQRQGLDEEAVAEAPAELEGRKASEPPEADQEDDSAADGEEAEPADEEPVAVTVTRAEMALAEGDAERARALFGEALERDPTRVDAQLGAIRAGWSDESHRDDLADALEELAEREDLTPRQQYDIGRFAFSRMNDRKLANKLWEEVKERDPDLADTVDLDALIERTR